MPIDTIVDEYARLESPRLPSPTIEFCALFQGAMLKRRRDGGADGEREVEAGTGAATATDGDIAMGEAAAAAADEGGAAAAARPAGAKKKRRKRGGRTQYDAQRRPN